MICTYRPCRAPAGVHTVAAMTAPTVTPVAELEDSTGLLNDPERLRAKGGEDGYLFFRGLLPAQAVLEVRHDILVTLATHGWLKHEAIDEGLLNDSVINR